MLRSVMQRRPQKRRNVAIWAQGLWAHGVSASRVSTLFPPSHDSLVSSTQYTCLWVGVKGRHTRRTALGSFVDRSDPLIFASIFACRAFVCRPRFVERFLFRVCACVCVLASYPSLCGFSLAPYDAHELSFNYVCCSLLDKKMLIFVSVCDIWPHSILNMELATTEGFSLSGQ